MSAVDELTRSYLDLKWHFDPAAASAAGLESHDTRLGDYDDESMRQHIVAFRALAAGIEAAEVDELEDEIDRTALLGDLRVTLARFEQEAPHRRNPEFWVSHLFNGLYAILARRTGDPAARTGAVIDRLEAVPKFLDTARGSLQKPPSVFVDAALAMLGGGGALISQMAAHYGALAPELRERLLAAAGEALKALARFGAALSTEIEPAEDALAFAIGLEHFEERLRTEHALGAGAGEIAGYGTRLREETEQRIAELARKMDASRSWRDVVERLREERRPPDDLLGFYAAEVARARAMLVERDLVTLPDGDADVVATPSFMRPILPFAAYEPPPIYLPDRTGVFYVTGPESNDPEVVARALRDHCADEVPSTVVHESWPGHHLQIVTAQGLVSEARRQLWSPLMVEGWALYAEELMDEEGFYVDDAQRLFHLVNLLWRAVRIELDVALHTGGMTPAHAVRHLLDAVPMEHASAVAEVRRYCSTPTYQLCYALGRRELLKLRELYRKRAGASFRLKHFHDDVLKYGGFPVPLARWGMGLGDDR